MVTGGEGRKLAHDGPELPIGTDIAPSGTARQGDQILRVAADSKAQHLTIENDRLRSENQRLRDALNYWEEAASVSRIRKLTEIIGTLQTLLRQRTDERDNAEARVAVMVSDGHRERLALLETVAAATEQFISAETNANRSAQHEAARWLAEALKEWRDYKRSSGGTMPPA